MRSDHIILFFVFATLRKVFQFCFEDVSIDHKLFSHSYDVRMKTYEMKRYDNVACFKAVSIPKLISSYNPSCVRFFFSSTQNSFTVWLLMFPEIFM